MSVGGHGGLPVPSHDYGHVRLDREGRVRNRGAQAASGRADYSAWGRLRMILAAGLLY